MARQRRPQLVENPLVVPQPEAERSEWNVGGEEKACIDGVNSKFEED